MATEIQCPIENCDYEGEAQSVQAHITATPSGNHEGESGVTWQREIADRLPNGEQAPWERGSKDLDREQWETVDGGNGDNAEDGGEDFAEQSNGGNEESKDTPEEADAEAVDVTEAAETAATTGTATMTGASESVEGSDGIPIPVSKEVLFGLAIVAVLVVVYLNWNSSEGDQEEIVDELEDEADADGTGLIDA
jgi:hypothetical protein